MVLEIQHEDGVFHLKSGPPHTSEEHSDDVDTAMMAVLRPVAWGCDLADVTRAMDATGLDWRPQYAAERRDMQSKVAEYEREKTRYVDRIGNPANQDSGWFDKKVEEERCDDGSRLLISELSDLGRQLVHWVRHSRLAIVKQVLSEMEEAMVDGVVERTTARDMGHELLDGLQAELLDLRENDLAGAKAAEDSVRKEMGYEIKQLWIPMWSETVDYLRRNGDW